LICRVGILPCGAAVAPHSVHEGYCALRARVARVPNQPQRFILIRRECGGGQGDCMRADRMISILWRPSRPDRFSKSRDNAGEAGGYRPAYGAPASAKGSESVGGGSE